MERVGDVTPAPCAYAIGDLHGEVSLLRQLLLLLPYREQDTLVFLGDTSIAARIRAAA